MTKAKGLKNGHMSLCTWLSDTTGFPDAEVRKQNLRSLATRSYSPLTPPLTNFRFVFLPPYQHNYKDTLYVVCLFIREITGFNLYRRKSYSWSSSGLRGNVMIRSLICPALRHHLLISSLCTRHN